jgi:hypothetical protein
MNRQDACSTKSEFSCGTGKMPVLENGATYETRLGGRNRYYTNEVPL